MPPKEDPNKIVKALVTSAIIFNRKHTEEGSYIELPLSEARHLEASGKVMLGSQAELEAKRKELVPDKKAA